MELRVLNYDNYIHWRKPTYTGEEFSVNASDFIDAKHQNIDQFVEISGDTKATNAGTYNVTLSLKDKANTTWEDGTTDDKTVTWEIVKAKLTVTRYTPLYSGEEKVVTSVNLIAEDDYADFVTVSGQTSATEPGAYTVTLSLNDKINMTWSDGTTDDKTVKWKIQRLDWKNNVAVSAFVKKIYTGEEITVTSADFILAEEYADYITISGQTSETEKGRYTVTISLADKENMTWDDDTTEDKTVSAMNTIFLVSSLLKNKVAFEYHLFEKGAHGLSICTNDVNSREEHASKWLSLVFAWLSKTLGYVQ